MEIKLYQPYRTRGGWKAVPVEILDNRSLKVWHSQIAETLIHIQDGRCRLLRNYDLTEEWKEPVVHEAWVNVYNEGRGVLGAVHPTRQSADHGAAGEGIVTRAGRIACVKITFKEGEGL